MCVCMYSMFVVYACVHFCIVAHACTCMDGSQKTKVRTLTLSHFVTYFEIGLHVVILSTWRHPESHWGESFNEGLATLGWTMNMSTGDYLN